MSITPGLKRPIRCKKCGVKFRRLVAQQRYCDDCLPLRVKLARQERATAARQQRDTAGPPRRRGGRLDLDVIRAEIEADHRKLARKVNSLSLAEFLSSPCMHGKPIIDCGEMWCRNRIDDLEVSKTADGRWRSPRYYANPVLHPWVLERPSEVPDSHF